MGESGISSWLNVGESDSDMEDIRDVCSYFYHLDHFQRSQKGAKIISMPFSVVDHIWAFAISALHSLGSGRAYISSPVEQQILKAKCALLSMVSYCVIWALCGNYGKLAVSACLVVNRNLYSAILLRKNFGELLLALFLGENFSITVVKPNNMEIGEKKGHKAKSESVTSSDQDDHEIDDDKSDDSIDLNTTASIWRRIDEVSTSSKSIRTKRSNRTSGSTKTHKTGRTTKRLEDIQEEPTSKDYQKATRGGLFSSFSGSVLSSFTMEGDDAVKTSNKGRSLPYGHGNSQSVISQPSGDSDDKNNAKKTTKSSEGRSQQNKSETSTAIREKKRKMVRFYKAIKRRIEGRKRHTEDDEEDSYDLHVISSLGDESSLGRHRSEPQPQAQPTNRRARELPVNSGRSAMSQTTKESTLTSMGRDYEDLVMDNSYIVSANPSYPDATTIGETTIASGRTSFENTTTVGGTAYSEKTSFEDTSAIGDTLYSDEAHTAADTTYAGDYTVDYTEAGSTNYAGEYTEAGSTTYAGDYTEAGTRTYAGDYTEAGTTTYAGDCTEAGNTTFAGDYTEAGNTTYAGERTETGMTNTYVGDDEGTETTPSYGKMSYLFGLDKYF